MMKWFDCKYCGKDFKSLRKKLYCDSCRLKQSSLDKSSTTRRMIRNREFIKNYKKDKKCSGCGYNKYPGILEFHHKDKSTKYKGDNFLSKSLRRIDLIQKEIEKCHILCPNCHRELHLKEGYGGRKNGI